MEKEVSLSNHLSTEILVVMIELYKLEFRELCFSMLTFTSKKTEFSAISFSGNYGNHFFITEAPRPIPRQCNRKVKN